MLTHDSDKGGTDTKSDEETRTGSSPNLHLHSTNETMFSLRGSFRILRLLTLDESRLGGIASIKEILHEREQDGDDDRGLESFLIAQNPNR